MYSICRVLLSKEVKRVQDDTVLQDYPIPENVLRSRNLFGFPKRNWVEGLAEALLVGWLINFIPFVLKVRVIVLLVVCVSILVGNLIGIKNRSVIQIITAWLKHKKTKARYHLGSVANYEGRKRIQDSGVEAESPAEKLFRLVKSKVKEYSGDDDEDLAADPEHPFGTEDDV